MKRIFFMILLFLNLFIYSFSEIILKGESNYTSLSEPVRIAIEFRGIDKDGYEIEGIENFNIMGRTTRTNYSIVNFKKNVMLVDIYQLRPLSEGTYQIRVRKGREYSNTIEITVGKYARPVNQPQNSNQGNGIRISQGGGSSSYGTSKQYGAPQQPRSYMGTKEDFKIVDDLDKKNIYLGEKIIYSEYFRAYGPLRSFEYKERPKFENMSSADYTPINNDRTLKKREYTQNGSKVIELTLYRGVVQGNLSGEQSFYTGVGEVSADSTFLVPARKIKINVKPLPEEGKPENFQGVVGEPNNQSKWDDKVQEVGKTVLLTLKINGSVNLDNLDKLGYVSDENFNIYTTLKASKEEIRDGKYYSEKEYEVAFIPKKSGELKIPDYKVNYFNPKTGKYASFTIAGKTLNVAESKDVTKNVGQTQENQGNLQNLTQGEVSKTDSSEKSNIDNKDNEKKIEENKDTGVALSIVKDSKEKLKVNYWVIALGIALLLQSIFLLKIYLKNKKITILKTEENFLSNMEKSKTNEEFYEAYVHFMIKTYYFNPKLHSETKLEDERLKEINRILEEWKFKGTEFNKEDIIIKLRTLSEEFKI